jgi:hypothetical protein
MDGSDPSIFLVNRETNKQWNQRLELINGLANWVCSNLNPVPVKWDESNSHLKKSTEEGKLTKAYQYVYEHLAVGKMKFPLERVDPLFTQELFQDDSMIAQLTPGEYPEFQRKIRAALRTLRASPPDDTEITWASLQTGMSPATHGVVDRLRKELCERVDEPDIECDWVDQEMIGLVLRYKCMGAFSNNLHGSVPSSWMDELGNQYVECFASPFNHTFDKYYSIYEQDKVFGSMGNFFAMIELNSGRLPAGGKYEINPPWNNQMYERLEEILDVTLACQAPIEAIIVGPKWTKTSWIPGITSLILGNPNYARNSFKGQRELWYINDMTGTPFKQKTVFWVFSRYDIGDTVLNKLQLSRPTGPPRPNPKKTAPGPREVQTYRAPAPKPSNAWSRAASKS